ncbi:MarR family winged helix-turn-helix transcriptional regulator [Actinomadura alba]|uniref:MarR family transcriptional regulator n=1 Tax=Actinomadura alba TaxID=406431 RepID=A0ABR7LL91_9ACTN|nr:MarR family transcriptional regulator [Actinomadura alba]MBC6465606.1 MarR family transcriptional regulator [Actinomadura alba]
MGANSVPEGLTDELLTEIGVALFHLRRVWAKPDLMRKLREQTHCERPLQMSNLSVVSAVFRLTPETGGEVTVGGVADRLDVDPSTASRLVGHAIDAGLVSRRPSPSDARRANLQLTDAGLRVVEAADRYRRLYIAELMNDWTAGESKEFARLLSRFTEAAAKRPIDPSGIDLIFKEAEARTPVPET